MLEIEENIYFRWSYIGLLIDLMLCCLISNVSGIWNNSIRIIFTGLLETDSSALRLQFSLRICNSILLGVSAG